ncbi:MAG: folate family ECF transporter S component [Lawsonibacter sp.]|nr:folate family ECF transporter S component [Lawsonibacter sp.]
MSKFRVRALCQMAILIAFFVLLDMTLVIKTGNWELTFASLPVVVGSLMFGPLTGMLVAAIGEFMSQMLSYGLTPTTAIWILPPMGWALVVGTVAAHLKKTGSPLENRPVFCYAVCILGGAVTSGMNTLALWLDSLVYHYYAFAFVFGSALLRLPKDIMVALIVATVAIPLVRLLQKNRVVSLIRE